MSLLDFSKEEGDKTQSISINIFYSTTFLITLQILIKKFLKMKLINFEVVVDKFVDGRINLVQARCRKQSHRHDV